ncbi:MAG: putative phage tail protein, partial [Oscillospiraceae bacterium]
MLKTANILTMLPDVLRNVWELQAVALAEDKELNKLWQETEKVFCDQFVETATENGVSRWEQMLNIAAKPSDTLAERKFKILSLLSAQLPFTISSLQEQLKNLCGENGYRLSVNHGTYTL